MKSEGKVDKKKTSEDSAPFERKEPSANEFTAPGELESGYTEESWVKPEKSMEDKTAERTEKIRHHTPEETILRKDMEAREREIRERKPSETKERGDLAAREIETSKREDKEKEIREREAKKAR